MLDNELLSDMVTNHNPACLPCCKSSDNQSHVDDTVRSPSISDRDMIPMEPDYFLTSLCPYMDSNKFYQNHTVTVHQLDTIQDEEYGEEEEEVLQPHPDNALQSNASHHSLVGTDLSISNPHGNMNQNSPNILLVHSGHPAPMLADIEPRSESHDQQNVHPSPEQHPQYHTSSHVHRSACTRRTPQKLHHLDKYLFHFVSFRNCCHKFQSLNPFKLSNITNGTRRWCDSAHHRYQQRRRHRLPNENMLILSVIQLLCGFASILLSAVSFTKTVFLYQMATGLWAGSLMLVAGFYGLLAARRPIMCMLIVLLMLCIVVSLAACVLIFVSVAGTIEDGFLAKNNLPTDYSKQFPHVYIKNFTLFIDEFELTKFTKGFVNAYFQRKSDSYLQMCRIVLHILLLLVGILEASVSLATSILCCRCVCSNSPNRFQNPRSSRTNIVSFNVETANQAVSLLRSGMMNNFAGPGNVLLAIDSNVHNTNSSLEHRDQRKPNIHPTLIPFIPELDHALILTQAGSGAVALSAARAAANLIEPRALQSSVCSPNPLVYNSTNGAPPPLRKKRFSFLNKIHVRLHRSNATNRRSRLLYTSFHIPSNRPEQSNSFPNPPSLAPSSTIVYVIPSPTREEPPMIFPPFPPSYNDTHNRLTLNNDSAIIPGGFPLNASNARPPIQSGRRARHLLNLCRLNRNRERLSTRFRLSTIFSRQSNRSRNFHSNRFISRSLASAPIFAGDRLIQPVLIIGDHSSSSNNNVPPPEYSLSNQNDYCYREPEQ